MLADILEAMEHVEEVQQVVIQPELVRLEETAASETVALEAEVEEWLGLAQTHPAEASVGRVQPTLSEEITIQYAVEVVELEQIIEQRVVQAEVVWVGRVLELLMALVGLEHQIQVEVEVVLTTAWLVQVDLVL